MSNNSNEADVQQLNIFELVSIVLRSLVKDGPLKAGLSANKMTPFTCAVFHALHELGEISATANFNEEDRTASLIGHLGTHFGWYGLMRRLSNPTSDSQLDHLCWAYQRKKDEAAKGGDFGLAIPISPDKYRIAFFQAKLINAEDQKTIDVNRPPSGYNTKSKKISVAEWEEFKQIADAALCKLLIGEVLNCEDGKAHHQLVKLAIVSENGRIGVAPKVKFPDWVHYVLWPSQKDVVPSSLTLSSVIQLVQKQFLESQFERKEKNIFKIAISESTSNRSFADLLIDGALGDGNGWLTVNKERAEQLIGRLIQLCPNWLVVDESGTSGGMELIRALETRGNTFVQMAANASLSELPIFEMTNQEVFDEYDTFSKPGSTF